MTGRDDGLQPFYAMEINALAGDLERAGRKVCHLEVGEPDAPIHAFSFTNIGAARRLPPTLGFATSLVDDPRARLGLRSTSA